jgi:DNA-directed RNA polymerase subunit RPC12/RpoP
MAERPAQASYDVVCPHCNKPFEAELLTASSSPARGFKCPHCRLFVPFERATGQHLAD